MDKGIRSALTWATIGLGVAATAARAQQVIERDTKLTGPRGRTIERDIRVERGPGYIDRRIEIKRPGGTLTRDTRIAAPTGPHHQGGHRPGPGPGPRFYGGGRPVIEEIYVPPAPAFSTFVGLPGFSLFLGGPPAPPPPPVFVYPEPVYPEPVYAYPAPPVVVAPPPPPSPPPQQVIDPLTEPLSRLKSFHGNSRRDGCLAIGHFGDDRAVPSLVERLEHDFEKEVRVAAAWALGEIGDPRAAVALERAALYDKRNDVRVAAKAAYARLPRPGQGTTEAPTSNPTRYQPRQTPVDGQTEVLDPGPSARPAPDDLPPPPPGPTLEAPRPGF